MGLTKKQRAFIEEYLRDFNTTQAAIRAGYSERSAYSTGWETLRKPEVEEAIQKRLQEKAMSADEVLMRLADMARADLGPYMDDDGEVDLGALKEDGKTHLIHTVERYVQSGVSQNGAEWENVRTKVKAYSALDALQLLGKHHKLFTDKVEHSGTVNTKAYIGVSPDDWDDDSDDD